MDTIVNDIINPPPVKSLGPRNIMVEFHPENTTIKQIENVYPFETIFNLKQRITLALGTTPLEQIFIAVEEPTKPVLFRPLEFTWLLNDGLLKDPLEAPKQPDPHLYQEGAKMAVSPSVEYGITLEDSNLLNKTIHVWTLESVLKGEKPSEAIFEGFIRLYFPQLTVMPMSTKISQDELNSLTIFRRSIETSLNKINAKLANKKNTEFPKLNEIYIFRTALFSSNNEKKYDKVSLEILFRNLEPNENRPFIRFFSGSDRIPPITKIAKKGDTYLISNPEILDHLMSDRPSVDMGAMIMIKLPVDVLKNRNLLGLCWTLRIYEDGSAEFYIGSPRLGQSIDCSKDDNIMHNAQKVVDGMLANTTDWSSGQFKLCDLSAKYTLEFPKNANDEAITIDANELGARLNGFLPMFYEEPKSGSELAVLRYKAVSNFVKSSDPIMNFLTMLSFNTKANESFSPTAELTKEFGITLDEATEAFDQWERIHSEQVLAYKTDTKKAVRIRDREILGSKSCFDAEEPLDEDLTIAAYNDGILISIYKDANYNIVITGCRDPHSGTRNLCRILSLLTVLLTSEDKVLVEQEQEQVESEEAVPEENQSKYDLAVLLGMMGNEGVEEEEEEEQPSVEQIVPKRTASKGQPVLDQYSADWILNRLRARDKSLFGFEVTGDKRLKTYSARCQKPRQPIVITKETYNKIKAIYRDKVNFLEVPVLNKTLENALLIGSVGSSRASNERTKKLNELKASGDIAQNKVMLELKEKLLKPDGKAKLKTLIKNIFTITDKVEVAEFERYSLIKGYPLESDWSVTDEARKYRFTETINTGSYDQIIKEFEKKYYDDETKDDTKLVESLNELDKKLESRHKKLTKEIDDLNSEELREEKKKRPTWTITITGTNEKNLNYYICTEYWCLKDDLPLLKAEFESKKACPFCNGTLITNEVKPEPGQTVLYRELAKYSGFLTKLHHPKQFALPCCFEDPKHIFLPDGSMNPLPGPIRLRDPEDRELEKKEIGTAEPDKIVVENERVAPVDRGLQSRPLRPFLNDKDNKDFIPNQNVFGRINKEWIPLAKGKISIPPPVVNKFIGQNPDDFLTKSGVEKQGNLSYLLPYGDENKPARAFIKYVIDDGSSNILKPGRLFMSLLSWAEYAVNEYDIDNKNINNYFESNPEVFKTKLMERIKQQNDEFKNAFEQANYGTLVHEFSSRNKIFSKKEDEVNEAWQRFKNYLANDVEPKELRLFESLFEVPGLFTTKGFILVRFVLRIDKDPVIECPDFGIAYKDLRPTLPFLFILQTEVSHGIYTYEPLILYNGKNINEKELYGLLDLSKGKDFPNIYDILTTYTSEVGCGRHLEPFHIWATKETKFPTLLELETNPTIKANKIRLFRERSNRLVGIVLDDGVFIPCADDGSVSKDYKSIYNYFDDPANYRDYKSILNKYGKIISEEKTYDYKRITPIKIYKENGKYTGIELSCGIIIPIISTKASQKLDEELKNTYKLSIETKPWNRAWMEPSLKYETSSLRYYTKEEQLEEAYQHLRITLAEYLGKKDINGNLKTEIINAQQAYIDNKPLYYLQKQLEAALKPHVDDWVILDDRNDIKPYDFRRNCTSIKNSSDCKGGCIWKGDKCMIHTKKPERFGTDVDIYSLMTARLADELIRTFVLADEILSNKISRIIPVKGISETESALTFTEIDKAVKDLFRERQPTEYTAGLTYPEERLPI